MYKLLAGFVLGILLGSFFDLGLAFTALPLLIGLGLLVVRRREYLILALIFMSLAGGIFRINLTLAADPNLVKQVGQEIIFKAEVVAEPDKRDNTTLLTVKSEASKNKILITLPAYTNYQYGDELELKGKLEPPQNFTTEAGKVFDYKKYLEKEGIFFTIFQPEVKLLANNKGYWLVAQLLRFKNNLVTALETKISEPESSLAAGLVVGEKQALGKEWNERFRAVGLSHIVVLSGYNLSVVAENILRLTGLFLSQRLSLGTGAVAIILFAMMVGGGATVLRASIMALIALMARATGRSYEATRALFIAGVLMLLWNPKILVFDLGFQLSFLATLGVIHGPVLLAPYFSKLTNRWGIKDILLTTLSAQIIVLPWILYTTGNFSLVALPANLLVLPFIPATMLFGFLTTFISPFAVIAHLLLAYILLVVKIFAAFPLAAFSIKQFPFVLVIVCYGLIFNFWRKINNPALPVSAGQKNQQKGFKEGL